MLFSSVTFLFVFLPAVIIGYYLLPKNFRNFFLLLASIIFYGFGEPKYLILMLAVILINYVGTLLLHKFDKYKKLFLFLTIITDIGFLAYFKYVDFLIESFNAIFKTHADILHIALPLGISFYIFQAISYTADVYKGQIKPQTSLYKLALYITLFPQLIAGPIVKYHDIANQIDDRQESVDLFYYGLRRFIIGLTRKVIIANTLGLVVDRVIALDVTQITVWQAQICTVCYAFQIYNDFAGYADMAVGLCAMFGFKIKENFNYPFISQSYTEFWHRWHISLGTWVKEYIYIPMGGNRCHPVRHYFNLFSAFFIIGIWHGADANMVMLGLYNAVLVIAEKLTGWSNKTTNKISSVLHYLYMVPVLSVSYFFLRSPDFSYSMQFLKRWAGFGAAHESNYTFSYFMDGFDVFIFIIAVFGAFGFFDKIWRLLEKNRFTRVACDICFIFLLVLTFSFIACSTYNPFIYFRF